MRVSATKLTPYNEMDDAFRATSWAATLSIPPGRAYAWEHSPIYTQMFRVEIYGISNRVHTHLVRHNVGVSWYVRMHRPDRVPNEHTDLRDMTGHLNAMALINISRQRICYRAWHETRECWLAVRDAIALVDPPLAQLMVPNCVYRGGLCPHRCKHYADMLRDYAYYEALIEEANYG